MFAISTFCLFATIGLVKGVCQHQVGLLLSSPDGFYSMDCSDEAGPTDFCPINLEGDPSNQSLYITYNFATEGLFLSLEDASYIPELLPDGSAEYSPVNVSRCCIMRAWLQLLCANSPDQINAECADMVLDMVCGVTCNLQFKPPPFDLSGVTVFDKLKRLLDDNANKTVDLVASIRYESEHWRTNGINEDLTLYDLRVIFLDDIGHRAVCMDVFTGKVVHGSTERNMQHFRITPLGEPKTVLYFGLTFKNFADCKICTNKSVGATPPVLQKPSQDAPSVFWSIFLVVSLLCNLFLLVVTCRLYTFYRKMVLKGLMRYRLRRELESHTE